LDDDVIFHKDFATLFPIWINNRLPNWKIVLLGASQHVELGYIPTCDSDRDNNGIGCYQPLKTDGSFAVGLHGEDVLRDFQKKLAIKSGDQPKYVDSDILRYFCCFVAYPNLIIADVTHSDIRANRDQAVMAKKVHWDLALYKQYPKPLISVIVACYNASRTIKRCLQSLIDQTYRPMEIIVVDDCSNDNSFEMIGIVLHKWQFNPKVSGLTYKLLRKEKNSGCYSARNSGIGLSTGDFIAFQDADDISLDYRIEEQLNALMRYDVKFTTCLILRTHLHKIPFDKVTMMEELQRSRIHIDKFCCRSKVGLVTTMFRKKVIEELGLYPLEKWGADATYLYKLFPGIDTKQTQMMNYLDTNRHIPKIHYCHPEILYLSHEMTHQNLTYQRKLAESSKSSKKLIYD
jgi:hypothetical protein